MGGGVTREQDASLWPPTWADTRGPMLSVGRGGQRARDQVEPGPVQHRALAPHAGPAPRDETWLDLGSGDWDEEHRASEIRVDRVIRVDPAGVRREGAVLDRARVDLTRKFTRSTAPPRVIGGRRRRLITRGDSAGSRRRARRRRASLRPPPRPSG